MTWVFVAALALVGAGLVWAARARYARLRPIPEAVEGRTISSLSSGRFRVVGRVVPGDTTPSAIDAMPCVYVERAEYRLVGSAMVPLLREVYRRAWAHPFHLQDDTGKLLLDPATLAVDVPVLTGDEGLVVERRLRAGEEIELVASFRPADAVGDAGPYRSPSDTFEPFEGEDGPPRVGHRVDDALVHPQDEVTSLLRGAGGVLLASSALVAILAAS